MSQVLKDDGRFLVALAAGQGGSAAELPQYRREPGNSWKLMEMCSNSGLFLHHAGLFSENEMCALALKHGYEPTGKKVWKETPCARFLFQGRWKGINAGFNLEGAILHVLVARQNVQFPPVQKLTFVRDVSVVKPAELSDALVDKICQWFETEVEEVSKCFVIDKYTAPNGREDRGIRFLIEGFLCKKEANDVEARLRLMLEGKLGEQSEHAKS